MKTPLLEIAINTLTVVLCSFYCSVVDMEGSGEVDRSDRNVKKIPPSGPKLKRSAEKRKLSEDTNLASANIKVSEMCYLCSSTVACLDL